MPLRWAVSSDLGGPLSVICRINFQNGAGQPIAAIATAPQPDTAAGTAFALCMNAATVTALFQAQAPAVVDATLIVSASSLTDSSVTKTARTDGIQLVWNSAQANASALPPNIGAVTFEAVPASATGSSSGVGANVMVNSDGTAVAAYGAVLSLKWTLAPASTGVLSLWRGTTQVAILNSSVSLAAGRVSVQVAWGLGLTAGAAYYLQVGDAAGLQVFATSPNFAVDASLGSPSPSPSAGAGAGASAAGSSGGSSATTKFIFIGGIAGGGGVLLIIVIALLVRCYRRSTQVPTVKSKHLRRGSDEEEDSSGDDEDRRGGHGAMASAPHAKHAQHDPFPQASLQMQGFQMNPMQRAGLAAAANGVSGRRLAPVAGRSAPPLAAVVESPLSVLQLQPQAGPQHPVATFAAPTAYSL